MIPFSLLKPDNLPPKGIPINHVLAPDSCTMCFLLVLFDLDFGLDNVNGEMSSSLQIRISSTELQTLSDSLALHNKAIPLVKLSIT